MWADTETDIDFLNYSEIAELIADLIADESLLPLSLGVFGGWGIGKSSTLNLIDRILAETPDRYLVVRFDAWLYQDFDDARAALMSVIAGTIVEAAPKSLKERATNLLARVDKLRLLGLVIEGGAAAMGFPAFGAAGKLVEAGGKAFAGNADEKEKAKLGEAAEDVEEKASKLLKAASDKQPAQQIADFRREFGEVLASLNKTLVVFIDNLDRCLPPNAIHTLEAIRLVLFMPKTAFVIAADEDMVRHAVAEHFRNPGERHVTDYLDKLIQMPVFVPRPGVLEISAYLSLLHAARFIKDADKLGQLREFLLDELRHSWREGGGFTVDKIMEILGSSDEELRGQIELGLRMAPMLAQSTRVNGNPRIVKRLMNVVRMRASIARRRKMSLDEGIIAKLALFERCTDGPATEVLQNAIQSAPDGRPELLVEIESAKSDAKLLEACPEVWRRHIDVIRDWVRLDPKVAGIDLRPAVYLSRETVPMRLGSSGLSPVARAAVEELLKSPTLGSVAAREAASRIEPSEAVRAMEEIIGQMRKNSEWGKNRADVRGAIILARSSPGAAEVLNRFLRSLPDRPKWLTMMIDGESWAEVD